MKSRISGYYGILLEINLTSGRISKKNIPANDIEKFIGGRGLGMKILHDRLKKPGIDPLSEKNPLIFMPGPFSGFPIPSSSRTCIVTKSPLTSPLKSKYKHASTVSYSNVGGFFGPEIRFAGYDGIVITGKSSSPVYIVIENEKVVIKDAKKFWGMGTDEFDKKFTAELGNKIYRTCYIGPAGENLVSYASIIHTAGRAAGRGGAGCIMGSKKLKAIAVRGTLQPSVANHKEFLEALEGSREEFKGIIDSLLVNYWRDNGTTAGIERLSSKGLMAVKNYREGTFSGAEKIGAEESKKKVWIRNFACYCCHLSCKKSGVVTRGKYSGIVHDGPEYETGVMFGANLMVPNLQGMLKAIYKGDDYGMDIISAGNVIGFLMEAYEKGYINKKFLSGIDLKWGNIDAAMKIIKLTAEMKGIGNPASRGVKHLSEKIGKDSSKFSIHVKGLELAAHNIHANPPRGICYATANRGGCHLNGVNPEEQNFYAMVDSLGVCMFATDFTMWFLPGLGRSNFIDLLTSLTGLEWSTDKLMKAGERIFNLEKMINYREGFRREDDSLPDRFFEEPLTMGPEKGAVLEREAFKEMMDDYYRERKWNTVTSRPSDSKLKGLALDFTLGY